EIGADGVLHLAEVAQGIELASLIVEALDDAPLDLRGCAREGGRDAVTGDREVRLLTGEGVEVRGRLRGSSDGRWVVEDGDGAVHFVTGEIEHLWIADAGGLEVRCQVAAAPGRHRVRIAYATTDLAWTAAYRVDVVAGAGVDDAAHAALQPTYTIAGSGLLGARRAEVTLLTGLPGGDVAPRAAWTGEVELGADAVSVLAPVHEVDVALDYVYRGAVTHPEDNARNGYWRATSASDVWLAIGVDLDTAQRLADLPAGHALVTVTRDGVSRQGQADWPAPSLDRPRGFDVWLWPDGDLVGWRERKSLYDDGRRLIEQYLFSVSNGSTRPIKVWVEEELRTGAASREIRKQWPRKARRRGDVLRYPVEVAPGKIERLGFEAEYVW
ncbi:MAG: hypothetical protein KC464_23725, partial [Myxococcales bacterium]|nr:hypothetical protein [Myxococcales bacterium]